MDIKKKTREEYDADRPKNMPPSSMFMEVYGRTFEEIRDGIETEDSSTEKDN